MTDKASVKGWVIRVTMVRPGSNQYVQIFDVAMADASIAMDAVRQKCGAVLGDVVEVVAELLDGTDLRDGEMLLR